VRNVREREKRERRVGGRRRRVKEKKTVGWIM